MKCREFAQAFPPLELHRAVQLAIHDWMRKQGRHSAMPSRADPREYSHIPDVVIDGEVAVEVKTAMDIVHLRARIAEAKRQYRSGSAKPLLVALTADGTLAGVCREDLKALEDMVDPLLIGATPTLREYIARAVAKVEVQRWRRWQEWEMVVKGRGRGGEAAGAVEQARSLLGVTAANDHVKGDGSDAGDARRTAGDGRVIAGAEAREMEPSARAAMAIAKSRASVGNVTDTVSEQQDSAQSEQRLAVTAGGHMCSEQHNSLV